MRIRAMQHSDAPAVAAIYNEGIRGRGATFRTDEQRAEDVRLWAAEPERHPVVVAEGDDGAVLGFARAGKYTDFEAYNGVGELAVYVSSAARGAGVGRALIEGLEAAARERGHWKLIAKVFPANEASIGLLHACGWRDVGVHLRHGQLDGEWLDVLVLERSL